MTSRRSFLKATGALGLGAMALPAFTAHADPYRPTSTQLNPNPTTLWYPAPADEAKIIEQGLPIGNGRLGALVGGGVEKDFLYLTDVTLWTGELNDALEGDGQLPYDSRFGTFSMLAKLYVEVPGHAGATGYRRELDLSNGLVTTRYTHGGKQYRREIFSSHPDDVVVVRLAGPDQSGKITLQGAHGEPAVGDAPHTAAVFTGSFANKLAYSGVVTAFSPDGTVEVDGADLSFSGCSDLVIVFSGGTNYVPDASAGFMDPLVEPAKLALRKAAVRVKADALLRTHVADYRKKYDRQKVDLGRSTDAQRAMDTWTRLQARASGTTPDPELEASYLQFGRYLAITGSRDNLPINLQGLWLSNNNPDWYSDYHTDINIQMNYWLADRAALSDTFDALANYCVAQLPAWTNTTQSVFQDSRNRFRNTNDRVAGWAVAFSTNIYGGSGWWWHPGGNAWLCMSLFEHYEYTLDRDYLAKIYPLLKGACEFWEARLVETPEGLVDDHDWSPEHGPQDARGLTYTQELVHHLFGTYRTATDVLRRDQSYGRRMSALRDRLYLPVVSPKTGMLQEWMSPDDLGETTHRHLSPLVGFFPGDRINHDDSPAALVEGVKQHLITRGMESFGWGLAWRAACWARLKDADRSYELIGKVIRPSIGFANGTAPNFFDMYSFGDRSIFQIDANLGAPAAMLEMLLYARPGVIELLPALPSAWKTGSVTGIGARGGFSVDLAWKDGKVTSATVRSVGGTETEVRFGRWKKRITLRRGQSVTLRP
ncbi:glycoside hydrolase family 95 protein [Lentzea flaviverrucosa]|uniref:Alpha-L-fucosidase 2 n=2 Tax=Lentzea TaxID=165301 RepID=A0A1H9XYH5_9PSEU|nr:glycoside hydrolase family 95 protein [Lentzea flaviverrucosa]RDI17111.1 alpha-L-fucosidase 2 [Lentzea flaviverrucosa]SES50817.1 alpha-L-fucosidase 2 [Lentzea flaviverrucosa]